MDFDEDEAPGDRGSQSQSQSSSQSRSLSQESSPPNAASSPSAQPRRKRRNVSLRGGSSSSSSSIGGGGGSGSVATGALSRRRRRFGTDDDDEGSASTSASASAPAITSSLSTSSSLVVRGAGVGAWAVQDAGTFQMLHDECSYLCSAILAARSPIQALEAALELAQLLAVQKTRAILWQRPHQETNTSTTTSNTVASIAAAALESPPASSVSPMDDDDVVKAPAGGSTRSNTPSVLESILDVLAAFGSTPRTSTTSHYDYSTPMSSSNSSGGAICVMPPLWSSSSSVLSVSSSTSSSRTGSPIRSKARTKSARRKLKQQQQQQQQLIVSEPTLQMNAATASSHNHTTTTTTALSTPAVQQVLAMMVYFLSMDCTLSKEHSVAALEKSRTKPALARSVRMAMLQHGKALQAMLRLCLTPGNDDSGKSLSTLPITATHQRMGMGLGSESTNHIGGTSGVSSVSFVDDRLPATPRVRGSGSKSIGDPTKAGRRNKRRRRQQMVFQQQQQQQQQQTPSDGSKLASVPEEGEPSNDGGEVPDRLTTELEWLDGEAGGGKIVPPPSKRSRPGHDGFHTSPASAQTRLSFTSEDPSSATSSFDFALPLPAGQGGTSQYSTPASPDRSTASSSASLENVTATASLVPPRLTRKIQLLRSKMHLASAAWKEHMCGSEEEDGGVQEISKSTTTWVSMVCLESMNRIITGKEGDSPSCLEPTDNEPEDVEDVMDEEHFNPILQTNRLLGKSGVIPLMAQCMSQALKAVDGAQHEGKRCLFCDQICHDQIAMLASLIDGACLFNKANRRSFAEHDPFSFDAVTKEDGLMYHILWFLYQTAGLAVATKTTSSSRSTSPSIPNSTTILTGIRLLALRTLTSLTHDNDLAAQQMTECYHFGSHRTGKLGDSDEDDDGIASTKRGIDVLAQLVFELQTTNTDSSKSADERPDIKGKSNRRKPLRNDDDLHRYDSTIFCLNTLANIIETSDVRRLLAEITVPTHSSGRKIQLWLQWLCQWLVNQTASFRDAILSIGKKDAGTEHSQRELEKSEEDKLVAAGNGCVLLACLMKEPEEISKELEATNTIRNLILEQMPLDENFKTTGVTMIINTLKAFCNFYHFSIGELSVAIVSPVKKLIDELEELQTDTAK